MNMPRRGIDVGDHLVDRGVAVGNDARAVGAGRIKTVDCSGQRERCFVRARMKFLKARLVSLWTRQALVDVASSRAPRAADPRLPEDQIGHNPQERDGDDDDHPGKSRRWLAVGTKQDSNEDRQLSEDQNDLEQRGKADRRQLLLSPVRRSERPPNRPPPSHL